MRTPEDIMAEMQALVDAAEAEDRSLTDDEIETYGTAEAELQAVNKTGNIKARHEAYKQPVLGIAGAVKAVDKKDEALDFAFDQYLRTGHASNELRFAQTEGTASQGGYLVPDGFRNKLVENITAIGGLQNEAEVLNTSTGNPLEWPTVTSGHGESDDQADVVAEGAASAVGEDIVFGTASLGAYRYASTGTGNLPIKVSVELLQDAAFDVGAYVAKVLGRRIARKFAKDIIQGSGSGEPLGLLEGTDGTVELAGGGAITYAKLLTLVHSLDPEFRRSSKWLFNDDTAAEIEALEDNNNRPLLVNGLQGIEGSVSRPTLLGYPVVIDQAAKDSANDVKFAAFGDLREAYVIRRVRDVQVLVNPYAATGYVVYDAWARMDGTVQNAEAFVTLEGET